MPDLPACDLDGQVAVVTGGNGGIGRAIALGLAGAGAKVAIRGRNGGKNAAALAALRAVGAPAVALQVDVANRSQLQPALADDEAAGWQDHQPRKHLLALWLRTRAVLQRGQRGDHAADEIPRD